MKRLESFLRNYSWLLKSGIWVLLIVWAAQFDNIIMSVVESGINQPPRDSELERKLDHALYELNEKQLSEAKIKGQMYGPVDYFDDFKEMELLKHQMGMTYSYDSLLSRSTIMELQRMSMSNVGKNRAYSSVDVSNAAKNFSDWLKSGGSVGGEFREQVDGLSGKEQWTIFSSWVSNFYLKGFFMAFLLFVVRMATRQGILETILADKIRFIYSLILWPCLLMKYPTNVVREIVVEAELRRMGNVFRKLTSEEREFVQRIARSSNFWKWIKNFHFSSGLPFERSFAISLVVVILIHAFAPFAQAHPSLDGSVRDGPEIISSTFFDGSEAMSDQHAHDYCYKKAVLFEAFFVAMYVMFSTAIFFCLRGFQVRDFAEEIDHVPVPAVCSCEK